MQEIIKSIKAFLYDRAVSPLFGAYVVSWMAWNYRVIIIWLDSHAELTEKFALLDLYFSDDRIFQVVGYSIHVLGGGYLVNGIFMPAVLTWLYLYGYPKVAIPVYEHSLEMQKKLKAVKQEIENSRLLTVEESRNLQREIEQLRFKADEEAGTYRLRISSLTQTINQLEEQLKSSERSNSALSIDEKEFTSIDELSRLVNRKVDEQIDGEFELSALFGSEWNKLSNSTRTEYGKLFKKIVERGDFPSVRLVGKGSGNQLIYVKNSSQINPEQARYYDWLLAKFPLSTFPQSSFKNDDERIALLKKIAEYLYQQRISKDSFDLLFDLVQQDGFSTKQRLRDLSYSPLSPIELDHLLDNLQRMGFVRVHGDGRIFLTDEGKAVAVSSGMTNLSKKILMK